MEDMIAKYIFGKSFEECSECEREAIRNFANELRRKFLEKYSEI